ncbi:MAG: hypothetical protein DA394_07100 [Candidatus Arcticimaribacter sp.]|nr:MAG: hypothetical protein DA394_07100 [Candidatus Arcticimaribacter sp.]
MKYIYLIIFLAGSPFIFAQSNTSSPYSIGGLGEIAFKGNAINRHMGGLDIVSDSLHANINNPASLGDLKLVTYSLGLNYKSTKLSSNASNESVTSASIDYLVVAIPTKKFTFGFGILPATSVGYRLQSVFDSEDINNVVNRNEGYGGLNQTFISIGFKVFEFLNFGVSANYNFGKITNESSRQEQNIDFGTFFTKTSSLVGFNYRFATQLKIPLTSKVRLDAMAYYVPENSLTATNESVYFTRSVTTQDLGDFENVDLAARNLKETSISLGDQYSFGLGITKEKKWFVGGQYSQRNSADYVNNFISLDNITYANGSRLSFGGFYLPDYSSITSYWKRIVYRAGMRFEDTGVLFNDQPLKETGISFGVSLPMAGYSNANIGIEFGKRGSQDNGLIQESYWNLIVGLSLNDIWFIKRKFN